MREHARLARARAGEDEQRPFAVGDGLALGRVEPREQLVDAVAGGGVGHASSIGAASEATASGDAGRLADVQDVGGSGDAAAHDLDRVRDRRAGVWDAGDGVAAPARARERLRRLAGGTGRRRPSRRQADHGGAVPRQSRAGRARAARARGVHTCSAAPRGATASTWSPTSSSRTSARTAAVAPARGAHGLPARRAPPPRRSARRSRGARAPTRRPREIVSSFLRSPEHRRTMLDKRFRDVGVGLVLGSPEYGVDDATTATLNFGRR